ncbi:IPT/TIG domain-containing protein [Haoranjiania flava]|uniref:IPT/TIG domain-containing protein n=1 Tax=Haoranjiania flava TaxID=1856322 RepID=A0AAE3LKP2_9BACT|nr:IPT/TIG domain-containing protein [Haoranjiania flava]MCU7694783.1 IPT/TIG domain-containing protein [Haoranjiania flava]
MKKLFTKTTKYSFAVFMAALLWASCKKDDAGVANPLIVSGPDSVKAGGVVILEGKDLAEIRSIIVELGNTPVSFNPVLNNRNAVIFRVPDTAWGGPTNLILTNSKGKEIKYPLVVITPPIIESISSTDYIGGMEIIIKGNNLQFVTEVALINMAGEPTGETAEIISKDKKKIVIKMPASVSPKVKLKITNTSSTNITKQAFVNIDLTRPVFLDNYATRMENWSWGQTASAISTTEKFFGNASLKLDFTGQPPGGGFRIWNRDFIAFEDYQEVAFWIKGADKPLKFIFSLDQKEWQNVDVPADVWSYHSFPISIWRNAGMSQTNSIVLRWVSAGTIVYIDNLVLIK